MAQAHVVDCTFFCSRWSRWICCGTREMHTLGELQPLVADESSTCTAESRGYRCAMWPC